MKNNEVIKSISYNQHEILYNIMQLYNDGKPFDCDMTYSKGNFYGTFKIKNSDGTEIVEIPAPKYKFDVYPQTEDTIKIEPLTKTPLEDESVDSVVVDLPFVISPPNAPSMKEYKKNRNIIANRFAAFYPSDELYQTYSFFIKEAFRVLKPNGLLVWKCQMTVSGGINHSIPYYSVMCGQKVGFTLEDEFILTAHTRLISGKVKTQRHSRKYHSNFLVFKKHTSKKYDKCNLFNFLEKYV